MPRRRRLRARPLAVAAVLVATITAGCGDDDDRTTADGDDGTTSVGEDRATALSATIVVRTEVPSTVALTATADDHEVRLPADDLGTDHEVALVGLRPETHYDVAVEATDESGDELDVGGDLDVTSGALPADFPPIELEADPERTQSGLTLLSLKPWGTTDEGTAAPTQDADTPLGYLVAVDQDGFVVWYHQTELGVLDATQLDDGNFLYTYDETVVREVDTQGQLLRELAGSVADRVPTDFTGRRRASDDATPMDTDSAHHDASVLPSGNLLVLSTRLDEVTGPPRCGEVAAEVTYRVISDVVAEIDPETGDLVDEWPLSDIYDPFDRPGEEMCKEGSPFAPPNFFYETPVVDWTHGNSVVVDEERNALIVSLRHLNAVLAIRYHDDEEGAAGELLWELGPDGTLPLDGEPSYYQHAAEVLEDGSILVYDNGNSRPGNAVGVEGDDPPYSRGVRYEVDDSSDDPADWSARQVWEHRFDLGSGRSAFTAFLGDIDQLENGNVLITHGAIGGGNGVLNARVIEVVPDGSDGGDVVFDLHVGDAERSWTVYRSQRFATLTR